jgi:Ca-activated chloride channel homolog
MRGRHVRSGWPGTGIGLFAGAGAVAALILALGWGGYQLLHQSSCTTRTALTVDAAPEIAPAVRATASRWATGNACVSVSVLAADPATVAVAVTARHNVTIAGLAQAAAAARVPDVWIPDSSTWLTRLRGAGTGLVPATAPSIARSPVVLAVPQPVATTLGWTDARLTWAALLAQMAGAPTLKAGIVQPGLDAAALNTVVTLSGVAASIPGGRDAVVATLRTLAGNRAALRTDLLARFPHAVDPAALATSLVVAPMPEQAVIAFNKGVPPVPLAAVAIDPAPAALDYPYAVLPAAQPAVVTAAGRLLAALAGPDFRDQLGRQGLRAADGSTGAGFGGGVPNPAPGPSRPIEPGPIDQALSTWDTLTQSGRILAVLDVSGSMLTPVPTAGGATREQVTVRAAAGGLALFDDSWSVGLWTFSTNENGTTPYRQLVPIGPLGGQRQRLTAALGTVTANKHGDTALYQTLLAAYQTVRAGWDGTKVNSVVIMTDGMNDNPGGMDLNQLIGQLQRIADPRRPVQVIVLGIGTGVAAPVMQRITQVTGGGVFIATDPASIGKIFLQAIALRPAMGN